MLAPLEKAIRREKKKKARAALSAIQHKSERTFERKKIKARSVRMKSSYQGSKSQRGTEGVVLLEKERKESQCWL